MRLSELLEYLDSNMLLKVVTPSEILYEGIMLECPAWVAEYKLDYNSGWYIDKDYYLIVECSE